MDFMHQTIHTHNSGQVAHISLFPAIAISLSPRLRKTLIETTGIFFFKRLVRIFGLPCRLSITDVLYYITTFCGPPFLPFDAILISSNRNCTLLFSTFCFCCSWFCIWLKFADPPPPFCLGSTIPSLNAFWTMSVSSKLTAASYWLCPGLCH